MCKASFGMFPSDPLTNNPHNQGKNMSDHYQTETKEHRGHTITLKWCFDYDCEAPWEHEDGHGPVSDWTTRDKAPGELVLNSDRRSYRYYDYAEAIISLRKSNLK